MKRSRPLSITIPDAGVLFAESVHTDDFQMAPRTDAFHKLVYVARGAVNYAEAGKPVESVPTGMLLVIPAGVEHQISDEQPSTLFLLCLQPSFVDGAPELPALWRLLSGRPERRIALTGPTRHQIESAWRRAILEQIRPRTGAITTVRVLAAQTFVTLARLPVTKPTSDPLARVAAVAREMDVTFCDEWDLDSAATRAGVSRRHFSMLFRKVSGRTFWEYLTNLRLTHATELLSQGDHSVTGVVFSCGFGDVSQFYRLFRERFRVPPKQWALNARRAGRGITPRRRTARQAGA